MTERDLFLSALEIDDLAERQRHLAAECAGNPQLLQRVGSLLASLQGDGEFLQTPALEQLGEQCSYGLETIILGEGCTLVAAPRPDETLVVSPTDTSASTSPLSGVLPLEALSPPARPDSLGRLGHYEILQVLGRGAFGSVFKAFDEKLQRVVAIKVLAADLSSTPQSRDRFLREARAAAAIRHDHVVAIYSVEESPLPLLVMEYIPGQTLQHRLDDHGALPVADVVRLGAQIAEALAAAHARGLIHRDIKPGNILLESGPRERVKITDFGLACAADDASLAQNGLIAGTPMYMAPEQAFGGKVDQRADLFSFGSVLYQMLSGKPAFPGDTSLGVLKRLSACRPRPIQEIVPGAPAWLCQIIARLQARDPAERYGSASEVARLLTEWQSRLDDSGSGLHRPDPAVAASVPPAPQPVLRRSRRRVAVVVLLTGLAMCELTGLTNLAATVIRVMTPEGTLVVEVDDPEVRVTIDGGELTIHGVGLQEFRLKTGEHKLRTSKHGQFVRQEIVNITQNGRQVVRIQLEPPRATAEAEPVGAVEEPAPVATSAAESAAWEASVSRLPAADLIRAVAARLQQLNPKFSGEMSTRVDKGVVVELDLVADHVTDISPLRVLTGLKSLICRGSDAFPGQQLDTAKTDGVESRQVRIRSVGRSKLRDLSPLAGLSLTRFACFNTDVADLSPLRGMPLTVLECSVTRVDDLEPLRGMPLQILMCGYTRVTDISVLAGMPLTWLSLKETDVADLSPLRGMKLTNLSGAGRKVTDLSPLEGMPLVELVCDNSPVADLAPLRGMPLQLLSLSDTKVSDLTPLQTVTTLKRLACGNAVSDLSPLAGLRLEYVQAGPLVTDLSPLQTLPLQKLEFRSYQHQRDAQVLRGIATLELVNDLPLAEFWKSVSEP